MENATKQKPTGIIITSCAEVEKFSSIEDYIAGTFLGQDLSETMENTSLEYFADRDLAEGLYNAFTEEIHERVSYQMVHDVIRDKIEKGTIDEVDYAYYFKVQMTIDAISEICAELYCDQEKVDANPKKILGDIFKDNGSANENGGR